MKLKIYCLPFVLPFLEAKGFSRDLDSPEQNTFAQKIKELFQETSLENTQDLAQFQKKLMGYNAERYNLSRYHSSIEITIDEKYLPVKTYQSIIVQGYVTVKFSNFVKSQICNEFMEFMYQNHIPILVTITKVIEKFYEENDLDESIFSSEILRKYWARNKDVTKLNAKIEQNSKYIICEKFMELMYLERKTNANTIKKVIEKFYDSQFVFDRSEVSPEILRNYWRRHKNDERKIKSPSTLL